MAQRPIPPVSGFSEAHESAEGRHTAPPSAELRVERSRFSRLLARFGLGELTDPILRPAKGPSKRTSG
jgi:hypothetical protein